MKLFPAVRLGILILGITLAALVIITWVGFLVWPSWSVNASAMTSANARQVWAMYAKLPSTPRWNPLVKDVSINGPFALGTIGADTWFDGSNIPWQIVSFQPNESFTQIGNLPFAQVKTSYYLLQTRSGTRIDQAIQVDGLMAWFYEATMRREFETGITTATKNLAEVAAHGLPSE